MVAVALVALLSGCRDGTSRDPADDSPGGDSVPRDTAPGDSGPKTGSDPFVFRRLILLTLDTLRTDVVTTEHMPFLARLQESGLSFANVWGQTWTYAGIGQILTAQHPVAWGAESWVPTDGFGPPALAESIPTLATAARDLGWASIYFTSNDVAGAITGLDRGYGEVRPIMDGASQQAVEEVADWAADQGDGPQLVHFHLNDTHVPYDRADAPCAAAVEALDPGACRYDFRDDTRATDEANADIENGTFGPDASDWAACVEQLETAYLCEVDSLDLSLAETFSALAESGLLDGSVLLVATDHGEGLLDPLPGHTFDSHATITRTFAVLVAPGLLEPSVVTAPVSQVDFVPGLAALLGLDLGLPTTGIPWWEAEESRVLTTYWVGTTPGGEFRHDHGAIGDGYHYLSGSTGITALYDLRNDPEEQTELIATGVAPPAELVDALAVQERATVGFGLAVP